MSGDEFKALGNDTRYRIVNRLRMGPRSVADIAKSMKVSRPAVSQGLKILMEANLVEQERRGRKMFYRLNKRGFEYLESYVAGVLDVIEKYGHKEPGE